MIADITLREFIAGLFLAGGAFFLLASAIVMLRLPDFYMIFLLIFLGNPIGTHILSKAAYKSGHHVWTLEEDAKEEKNHADLPH